MQTIEPFLLLYDNKVHDLHSKMGRLLTQMIAAPREKLEILGVVPGKSLYEALVHVGLFDFAKDDVLSFDDLIEFLERSCPDWKDQRDYYEKTGKNLPEWIKIHQSKEDK
jgi:hypothetical protein